MLVLFDIDGTLLITRGVGVQACIDAGKALFGPQFTHKDTRFAGNLDPLIWRGLCAENGVEETREEEFRSLYGSLLRERLAESGATRRLPGALELVRSLATIDHLTLGLLTGNYPETGLFKLDQAGFDANLFPIRAWGIDGRDRRSLPPVALERYQAASGRALAPEQVVVIGDTPHDVDCARASGCRSLAVATGRHPLEELTDSGADHVAPDLTATEDLVRWIVGTA